MVVFFFNENLQQEYLHLPPISDAIVVWLFLERCSAILIALSMTNVHCHAYY